MAVVTYTHFDSTSRVDLLSKADVSLSIDFNRVLQ